MAAKGSVALTKRHGDVRDAGEAAGLVQEDRAARLLPHLRGVAVRPEAAVPGLCLRRTVRQSSEQYATYSSSR